MTESKKVSFRKRRLSPLERRIDRLVDKAVEVDSCCSHTEFWIDDEVAIDIMDAVITDFKSDRRAIKDVALGLNLPETTVEDVILRFLEEVA